MAAEGGAEAEQELPFTLLACGAMQARLEAWAEKRARAANLPPPPKGPSRGDAAAKTAERAAERAARERSMDGAFPALPGSHPGLAGGGRVEAAAGDDRRGLARSLGGVSDGQSRGGGERLHRRGRG